MRKTLPFLLSLMLLAWAGSARASHYAVADVPRLITPAEVDKLHKGKIETTEQLLDKGAKSKDRKALAKATGLKGPNLLDLVLRCDLLRIKGVGWDYAELLRVAGVRTVNELRFRNPQKLAKAMEDANAKRKLVRVLPSVKIVTRWIEEAKALQPVIRY